MHKNLGPIFIILIPLSLVAFYLGGGVCLGTAADLPQMDRTVVLHRIAKEEKQGALLYTVTGEVIATERVKLTLSNSVGITQEYPVAEAEIYLNAMLSSAEALRPICPGRYIQARLYLNDWGEVEFVEAWYIGGEVRLVAVESESKDENYSVLLKGLDTDQEGWFPVSRKLNQVMQEIQPGTVLYCTLNILGEINYILVCE